LIVGSKRVVYYFVIGADGSRYGPADIDTLVQWAREGRVLDSTTLIERGTERELPARSITAIAAELRRKSGRPEPVVIERGTATSSEAPTLPRPDTAASPGAVPPPPVPPVANYANPSRISSRSRVTAGLLGIFLGSLGVHRFYLGYTGIGLIMLLLSLSAGTATLFCVPGAGCGFVGLWGFIEGIICLTGGMRDADGLELRS